MSEEIKREMQLCIGKLVLTTDQTRIINDFLVFAVEKAKQEGRESGIKESFNVIEKIKSEQFEKGRLSVLSQYSEGPEDGAKAERERILEIIKDWEAESSEMKEDRINYTLNALIVKIKEGEISLTRIPRREKNE